VGRIDIIALGAADQMVSDSEQEHHLRRLEYDVEQVCQ